MANKSLQLDIDRLFARKVTVFDHAALLASIRSGAEDISAATCLETTVNVLLKVKCLT
jgi:uncharacterized UPF0146 family protein